MSILIKGKTVALMMSDGRLLVRPQSHGIIHDPTGQDLPKCDVFIGPYRYGRGVATLDTYGKQYFGRRYEPMDAEVFMPEGPWRPTGQTSEIFYLRDRGIHASVKPYRHPFRQLVDVDRCGSMLRLRLPDGCLLTWRGFIRP